MSRLLLALPLLAACLAPAPAAAMSVGEFLGKVDGLYAKGPLALFSPDKKVLEREGIAAMEGWRTQAHAPNACPADPAKVDPGQAGFLRILRDVPATERPTTSVAQAVTGTLNRRYPCPRA